MIVNPGEEATLSCTVDGKPLTEEHIRWERDDYDMDERTTTSFKNGTSYLHIKDAQRNDVGYFRCIADNRVTNPTSRDVLLITKCKYELLLFCFNYLKSCIYVHLRIVENCITIPLWKKS